MREVLLRLPVIDVTPYPGRIAALSLRLMDGFVFAVPLICYLSLFFGYLELVRPVKADSQEWKFATRPAQIADLFFGIAGVQGFQPLNPSVSAALRQRSGQPARQNLTPPTEATKKLPSVSGDTPWIYPPWQTWAYLAGFAILCLVSLRTWQAGQHSVALVEEKHYAMFTASPGAKSHIELIKSPETPKETT